MPDPKRDPIKPVWDFFCSLKLTVFTLLLLAATSVVGTILPQNLTADHYRQLYGEAGFRLVWALQLFDMYHSWWFQALLAVFALNLTACSLRRLPAVWRTVTRPASPVDEALLRSLPFRAILQLPSPPEEARRQLEGIVRRRFARPRSAGEGDKLGLFAQKRAFARFGAYLTHLSILLILLGGVIGSRWGFSSSVNIVEGETIASMPGFGEEGEAPLGFSLRCDEFSVSYYEGSPRPREFRSILTVLEDGREVPGFSRIPVVVNRPLRYRGMSFYQSDYDRTLMCRVLVSLIQDGREITVEGYPGKTMVLPDGGSFRIVDYTPTFRDLGPAVLLAVRSADGERFGAIAPTAGPGPAMIEQAPYRFRLLDIEERDYTVLKVARDPGVPVVWAGCLLLVLGTLGAFFLSHQRLWLLIRPAGQGSEVRIGGTAHRNRAAFERRFAQLARDIAGEFDGATVEIHGEEDR
jgi:cytochrome c biogenesis protein